MNFFLVNLAVCVLASDFTVLGQGLPGLIAAPIEPSQKCQFFKSSASIRHSDCLGRGLKEIPKNLDPSTQALIFTDNRIKRLSRDSVSRYKNLEYLWMDKNTILNITEEAIAALPYLKSVRLAENVLSDLPRNLFQLQYLEELRLTENELKDGALDVEIKSPLVILELGKNQLTKVPAIGPQMALHTLNLSMNYITHVSVEDVAPFCVLKVLDLTGPPIKFESSTCDCFQFLTWSRIRNLKVIATPPITCNNATFESCERVAYSNKTEESHARCMEMIKVHAAAIKTKKTWTIAGSCVGVFVFCLLVWLYCIFKKNKKRSRKLKEEQRLAANNANTELLNGNIPEQLSVKTLRE